MNLTRTIKDITVRADQLCLMEDMRFGEDVVDDDELLKSIQEHGIKDALTCRYTDDPDIYEIIDGRRRFKWGQIAGYREFRITVEEMTDLEAYSIAFIKNNQRKSMSELEEAMWLKLMLTKFGLNQSSLGKLVSKSQGWVSQRVGAADFVRDLPVEHRKVMKTERQARAIKKMTEEKQKELLDAAAITGSLASGRELERLASASKEPREVLEKWRYQDDEFILHMLQEEAGLTVSDAAVMVKNFRLKKLPWQKRSKGIDMSEVTHPPDGDPKAEMYKKLSEWYPLNLLDSLGMVAPALSIPTWQNNCRRFIRLLLERTPVNVKDLLMEEFM